MDAITANPELDRLVFEAVVKPHRSLSGKGVWIVIGCMTTFSLIVTSMMYLLGAWPVIGFNGADIALAIFLLWLNMRAGRAREVIALSEQALRITQIDIHGRQARTQLSPYWLNVVLEERAGTVPKLILASRGRQTEVARQLGEAEKRDLAAALTGALHKWRNPRFNNPQLD